MPVTPVVRGRPVQFVNVPDVGVPRSGVVKLGDVVMATLPVPLITYSPTTPALSNRTRVVTPLVIVVEAMATTATGAAHVPSPRQKVVLEAPVPELRLLTERLPVTPVERGRPVQLVRTPAVGVPRAGVVKAGEVVIATLPVPLMVYSPTMPTLSNRILVLVPPVTVLVPTAIAAAPPDEAAHLMPLVWAESAVRTKVSVPTGSLLRVLAPGLTRMSPLT